MKILTILSLFLALVFFDCSSKKSENKTAENQETEMEVNTDTEKDMSENLTFEGETDGVKYKFTAEMKKAGEYEGINYPNDFIEIAYELENTGEKDFLVFNQGHFGTHSTKVYVEPTDDGNLQISQRMFTEPSGKDCPQRFVEITPKAAWLKSKQKLNEKVQVEMPLKLVAPYDDCQPAPKMPENPANAKFCLGIAEAIEEKVNLSADGRIGNVDAIGEQKLLCSDSVSLK